MAAAMARKLLTCALAVALILGSLIAGYARHRVAGGSPAVSNEEFVGPFASWWNVKTDCSATGNGSTNDTAAIQSCINKLGTSSKYVVWFPAGTYKISDVSTTASAGSGASSITVASGAGIVAGMAVYATGVPVGDTVANTYTPGSTTVPLREGTTGVLSATPVLFGLNIYGQQFISLIGADPATTSLVWAGSTGGTTLYLNGVQFSRIDRLSFDAQNVAGVIIDSSKDSTPPYTDTGNEFADDVFKNASLTGSFGFRCGNLGLQCSEIIMLRDQFINDDTGVAMKNANALDLYIWYSLFQNDTEGVSNQPGGGIFELYNNVFKSNFYDILTGNTGHFTFRGNYSLGSDQFFLSLGNCSNDEVTIQDNTILDTTATLSIQQVNIGPTVLLDNVIRSNSGVSAGPVVNVGNCFGDLFSMGNTFTATSPATSNGHNHFINDVVVSRGSVNPSQPVLPGTPPNYGRTIFEASPSGSGTTCSVISPCSVQQAVTSAANAEQSGTVHPVVHLPAGMYLITSTITVPATVNSGIQIIGDGGYSYLQWNTSSAVPVLKLLGPSQVVLRDFGVNGNTEIADGIEVDSADQPGSRIFMEQSNLTASTANLFVDALDYTDVELHDLNHVYDSGTGHTSFVVTGGPSAAGGNWLGGMTNIFAGSSTGNYQAYGVSSGAHVGISATFNDAGAGGSLIAHATGSGAFTYAGSALYLGGAVPEITLTNYQGTAALVTLNMDGLVAVSGNGSGGKVLGLGAVGPSSVFFSDTTSPADTMEFLISLTTGSSQAGACCAEITEIGSADPSFLSATLNQLRTALPTLPNALPRGVTDVQFYRVNVDDAATGIHLKN